MDRKILIIADSFSPIQTIGAIRPSKISKYLNEIGYDVTVITNDNNYYGIDKILLADQDKYGDIIKIKNNYKGRYARKLRNILVNSVKNVPTPSPSNQNNPSNHKQSKLISKLINLRKKAVLELKYYEEKNWAHECIKYIEENYPVKEFDTAFTSYGPASNLIVGNELYISKRIRVWISDFRDPMIQSNNNALHKNYYKLQKNILENSSRIIAVSKGIKDNLQNFITKNSLKVDSEKINVIYNGFDYEDIDKISSKKIKNDKFKIVYCGSLYNGRRDLSILFKALKRLSDESRLYFEKVEFHYAGGEGKLIQQWATRYGIESIIFNHGKIPREKALTLQSTADYVVAITWNGKESYQKGVIPGKIYETMMFNGKLVSIIFGESSDSESELKKLVNNFNLGYAFEISKDYSIKSFEEEFLNQLKRDMSNKESKSRDKNVHEFEYKNITKKIIQLMNEADGKSPRCKSGF